MIYWKIIIVWSHAILSLFGHMQGDLLVISINDAAMRWIIAHVNIKFYHSTATYIKLMWVTDIVT